MLLKKMKVVATRRNIMKTKSMTGTCSCSHKLTGNKNSSKFFSRSINAVKLAMPVIGYALIPKCPLCLAGYIAFATGIGLSVTTATYLRFALVIICVLSITYFGVK